MNFYKAKYLKNNAPAGRAYTFKSEQELLPGDKAETPDGKHVQIVDEPVDMNWVETYGAGRVVVLKEYVESFKEWRIVSILDSKTKQQRMDWRYPLRVGRIVKEPKPQKGIPMILEYLKTADGSDYSNRTLRTSRVIDYRSMKDILEIETVNSIYVFEPVKEQ